MKRKPTAKRHRWTDSDARSFADGLRVRAQTFTDRHKEAKRRACRGKSDQPD